METLSDLGDLTTFAKEVQKLFEKRFGGKPALAIAFTLPPDYQNCHWVTNVSRDDGILLFRHTATAMQAQTN